MEFEYERKIQICIQRKIAAIFGRKSTRLQDIHRFKLGFSQSRVEVQCFGLNRRIPLSSLVKDPLRTSKHVGPESLVTLRP